jgi:hypothetical protein
MRFKRYTAPHPARTALAMVMMTTNEQQQDIAEHALVWLAGNKPDPDDFREALNEYRLMRQCRDEECRPDIHDDSEGGRLMAFGKEGITWAPGVTCDLTQRYMSDTLWFEAHLDEASSQWLRSQDPEAEIAWLRLDDENYLEGWRAVPVAAVGGGAR